MQIKKFSAKQEKRVAKDFRGCTTVASGALWGEKGDVKSEKYLIECKATLKNYYSLKLQTWEKIVSESIRQSLLTPIMVIDLNNTRDKVVVFSYVDTFHKDLFTEIDIDIITTHTQSYRVKPIEKDKIKLVLFKELKATKFRHKLAFLNYETFLKIEERI